MKFRKGDVVTARFRVKYDVNDEDETVFMGHVDNEYRDLNLPPDAVTLETPFFSIGETVTYNSKQMEVVANVDGQLMLKFKSIYMPGYEYAVVPAKECRRALSVDEMKFIANPPKSFLPPSPMFPPKPEPDAPAFAAGDIPMPPPGDSEDRSGE